MENGDTHTFLKKRFIKLLASVTREDVNQWMAETNTKKKGIGWFAFDNPYVNSWHKSLGKELMCIDLRKGDYDETVYPEYIGLVLNFIVYYDSINVHVMGVDSKKYFAEMRCPDLKNSDVIIRPMNEDEIDDIRDLFISELTGFPDKDTLGDIYDDLYGFWSKALLRCKSDWEKHTK